MKRLPTVSIVIIGLNEADNLPLTFDAIHNQNYPSELIEVIYVDTGSTDDSINIAKKYTNKVYIEKSEWPTPGLARNRGLLEARYDIIHFIDGDITIDKDYLQKAVKKIQEPGIDAVYGYLEEKSKSGINDILLAHWKRRKEGFHNATGGGGTYKKHALISIDGYDERIRRGEETELGERFLNAGYKIWFMNVAMGIHDYNVKNLKDLIGIYFLDGVNKSHLHLTRGASKFYVDSKKIAFNNLFFVSIMTSLLFLSLILLNQYGLFLFIIIYYSYFIIKYLILKKIRGLNESLYFIIMYSMKLVTFGGQMIFYFRCLLNRRYYRSVINPKMKLSLHEYTPID